MAFPSGASIFISLAGLVAVIAWRLREARTEVAAGRTGPDHENSHYATAFAGLRSITDRATAAIASGTCVQMASAKPAFTACC